VALRQDVRRSVAGAPDFAIAGNGTLVFVAGGAEAAAKNVIVWVDRKGAVVGPAIVEPLDPSFDPRLSPDGRRLLLSTGGLAAGNWNSLWAHDLDGRPPILLADEGDNRNGVWNPDGRTIAFVSNRNRDLGYTTYTLPADGSVRDPQLVQAGLTSGPAPAAWLSNGELVSFQPGAREGDIVAVRIGSADPVREIAASADVEVWPSMSPDERWLAFVSNRTGNSEVWVMRYPDGAPVRVSRGGGIEPVWSRDGRELYFRQGAAMMAVPIDTSGETLAFEPAVELFTADAYFLSPGSFIRSYDVAADGRFLMIREAFDTNRPGSAASIVVVLNWMDEVRRRVPVP
jgi:TolB protein